ncbi:hypothetical protein HU200_031179 [Digitaria exilis]|uniref:Uncharacterized protein n=1 Tax=Digitaria exilis TaxID=1010633 RepID=A0A835BQR5_9POAL|nr:hypothetical protein HU200_031179 [Digitaria exilis]
MRWTVPVEQRAADVGHRCARACVVLADAAERLPAPPTDAAAAADARARLEVVRGMLADASSDLDLAASSMMAIELFALRGAAASPMAPLASVQHVGGGGGGDHPVRLALSLFQGARGCAEDASHYLDRCCGSLRTDDALLAVPGLPGADGLLGDEHFSDLRADVEAALDLARVSAVLAIIAHWLLER